jgi:prefoldin subunit 5
MSTDIGDTIVNDPTLYNLAVSLKLVRDQLASVTGGITDLNTQIATLQSNITLFTSNNVTLRTTLGAYITTLVNAETASSAIALDAQCVTYSASIRDNETAIANMTNLVSLLQGNLAVMTQQQTDIGSQISDILTQIGARMDVVRGITTPGP